MVWQMCHLQLGARQWWNLAVTVVASLAMAGLKKRVSGAWVVRDVIRPAPIILFLCDMFSSYNQTKLLLRQMLLSTRKVAKASARPLPVALGKFDAHNDLKITLLP